MAEEHTTYNSRNAEKSDIRGFERNFISLIILIYFGIVLIQCLPNSPVRDRAKAYADPVISVFGLKQRWNLFSPNIRLLNQYATSVITFKDGAVKLYEWPENRKFSFHEGIQRNQLRKFVIDGLNEPTNDYMYLWPASARFLALCHADPSNPPVSVEPVFNGFSVPKLQIESKNFTTKFKNYARQDQLNLRWVEHRTVNGFFQIRERDLKPGLL